jgi:hypothetical protein
LLSILSWTAKKVNLTKKLSQTMHRGLGKTWIPRTKSILIQSHTQLKQTCPILQDFSNYINPYKCLRLKIAKKFYNLLCETILQAFLHVFFIFFPFFTPGKQPYFEISEMTTHRNTHSDPRPRSLMNFRLR